MKTPQALKAFAIRASLGLATATTALPSLDMIAGTKTTTAEAQTYSDLDRISSNVANSLNIFYSTQRIGRILEGRIAEYATSPRSTDYLKAESNLFLLTLASIRSGQFHQQPAPEKARAMQCAVLFTGNALNSTQATTNRRDIKAAALSGLQYMRDLNQTLKGLFGSDNRSCLGFYRRALQ